MLNYNMVKNFNVTLSESEYKLLKELYEKGFKYLARETYDYYEIKSLLE